MDQPTSLSQLLRESYLAEARAHHRHGEPSCIDSPRRLIYGTLKEKADDSGGKAEPQFPDLSAFLSQEELDKSVDLACKAFSSDPREREERSDTHPPVSHSNVPSNKPTPQTEVISEKHTVQSPIQDNAIRSAREPAADFKRPQRNAPYGLETQSKKEFLNKAADFIEELSSLFKASSSKRIRPRKTHRSRCQNKTQLDGTSYSINAEDRERPILLNQQMEEPMEKSGVTEEPALIQPESSEEPVCEPPHFIQKLKSREVSEGSKVQLDCIVRGLPAPEVRWFCEGKELENSPDIQIIANGERHTLIIAEAFEEDTGRYSCFASNFYGTDSTSAEIYIEGASSSDSDEEKHFQDVLAVESQLIVLECRVKGIPSPKVDWYREGTLIEDSPDFRILQKKPRSMAESEEICTLVIAEVFPEDSGTFTCIASNKYGTVSSTAVLRVKGNVLLIGKYSSDTLRTSLPQLDPLCFSSSSLNLDSNHKPLSSSTTHFDSGGSGFMLSKEVTQSPPNGSASSITMSSNAWVEPLPNGSKPTPSPSVTISLCYFMFRPQGALKKNQRGSRLMSDDDIRESKETLLQDIEKILRFKDEQLHFGQQCLCLHHHRHSSLSRPLGPNIPTATVINYDKEYKVSNFEQRLMSEIEFRLERTPVEESDDEVQHDEIPSGKCIAPIFDKKLKNFRAVEGIPVTFTCKVVGIPVPKVYWFKDGKQILKRNEHYKKIREGDGTCSLHIEAITSDDDGNYTVMAANPQGRISCSGHLIVQTGPVRNRPVVHSQRVRARVQEVEGEPAQERFFRPHFLQAPGDMSSHEGRLCRLDCKVSGLPHPEIMWLLNGKPIYPDLSHRMLVRENGIHSLVIDPLTQADDGTYTCIASNKAGQSSFCLELRVVEKELKQPPYFVEKLQNMGIAEGTPVRLECRVVGMPQPLIYWKKDNDTIPHSKDRVSMHQDTTGYVCLLIQPTRKEDAGWYTVSAKNEAGIISCTARLDIYGESVTFLNIFNHYIY
uniref:Myopalladin n=1 Tax=Cyprinus carpio carpio TaxID=630221 RepID=A0A9J8B3V9_CYPCA